MWENAYLSIKNPKGGSGLCLQIVCATPLGYVSNFWPQKLPPSPIGEILDPYLENTSFWKKFYKANDHFVGKQE